MRRRLLSIDERSVLRAARPVRSCCGLLAALASRPCRPLRAGAGRASAASRRTRGPMPAQASAGDRAPAEASAAAAGHRSRAHTPRAARPHADASPPPPARLALTDPQGAPQAEIRLRRLHARRRGPGDRGPSPSPSTAGRAPPRPICTFSRSGPGGCRSTGRRISPSAPPALVPNAETWLDFTDLVFIDPPGTGYSRVVGGDQVRERFYSVEGDIDGLAAFITRWLKEKNRLRSPKFFVGESYGGFRGPLVAEKLQSDQGIGLSGARPGLAGARFRLARASRRTRPGSTRRACRRWRPRALEQKGPVDARCPARGGSATRPASTSPTSCAARGPGGRRARQRAGRRADRARSRPRAPRLPGASTRAPSSASSGAARREVRQRLRHRRREPPTRSPNAYSARFEDPVLGAMTAPLTSAILHHLDRHAELQGRRAATTSSTAPSTAPGAGAAGAASRRTLSELAPGPGPRSEAARPRRARLHRSRDALFRDASSS